MSTRQSRRAALRAQQEARVRASRHKKQLLMMCGAVILVVAIAFVVGMVTGRGTNQTGNPYANAGAQITPPHGDPSTGIITPVSGKASSSAPVVTVYSDFQCPWCRLTELAFGEKLVQLAEEGRITLQFRTVTFLESQFKNDSSTRAAEAAAAADTVGAYPQYYLTVYRNQPAKEGAGFTDDQLRNTFAKQAGITGDNLTKFQKYYDTHATREFVTKATSSNQAALTRLVGTLQTPTFAVNGKAWTGWEAWYDQGTGKISTPTTDKLLAAITSGA